MKVVLPFALAAVAYVLAGFQVDLPPYGIWLDGSRTVVRLEDRAAWVESDLAYRCTSWRPRGNTVYLPGRVEDLQATVPAGWTWAAHPDGVLLSMSLAPGARETARFTFRLDCPDRVCAVDFPVARGWGREPLAADWEVVAPPGVTPWFSSPALPRGAGRWALPVPPGEGLVIRW